MKHLAIHSKKYTQSGFSFIEIVLTLTLIALVLTPVFTLQYKILNLVSRGSNNLSRLFFIESLFSYAAVESKPIKSLTGLTIEKKEDFLETKAKYSATPIPEASSLKKIENLYLVRAQVEWKRVDVPYKETIISFIYKPELAGQEQKS